MNIGSGFGGETEKGKKYINIALDKALLELVPALKNVSLTLWFVPKDERKSEKSPNWTLSAREPFVKDDSKKEETSSQSESVDDEEIPF